MNHIETRTPLKRSKFFLPLVFLLLTSSPTPSGAVNIQINVDGFGDRYNEYVWSMLAAGDYLYVGTQNYNTGGEVWRYSEAEGWRPWSVDGFGDPGNVGVRNFYVWRGHLYAVTKNEYTGGEIWRLPLDAPPWLWKQVNKDGFGDYVNRSVRGIVEYRDWLYVTTYHFEAGGQVWRSPDGTCWERVPTPGLTRPENYALAVADVLGDYLYVGTWNMAEGLEIWRYAPEVGWEAVVTGGFGTKFNLAAVQMKTFQDGIYVGTGNFLDGGIQIWHSHDGTTWEQIGADGLWDPTNAYTWAMEEFEGHLYIGLATWRWAGNDGHEIWRYSDTTGLEMVSSNGFGERNNYGCRAIAAYKSDLYFGTANTLWSPILPPEGCEVWRWDPDMLFASVYIYPRNPGAWGTASVLFPWLFAEILLPCGYDFERIDMDTVRITQINGHERSIDPLGKLEIFRFDMIVFPMLQVRAWLRSGINHVSIEGLLDDGTPFGGTGEVVE